jgi:biopolymer transport protein ExbD
MRPLILPGARPRRAAFALTPLADAMFQLLVFFMLSSSLSPYALIPLSGGPQGQSEVVGQGAPQAAPLEDGAEVALWHLGRGTLRAGAVTIPLADLAANLPGAPATVILFPDRSARVQDVATALEALALHGITRVQLVPASGG